MLHEAFLCCPTDEATSPYLHLGREILALVASVVLPEALCHLHCLIHAQEPEVTAVNVPDGPKVLRLHCHLPTLFVPPLRSHGCRDVHHRVKDEWGDLRDKRKSHILPFVLKGLSEAP